MSRDLDTWAKRQGLPTIRRVLDQLGYARGGLSGFTNQQEDDAYMLVLGAMNLLEKAAHAIEGKPYEMRTVFIRAADDLAEYVRACDAVGHVERATNPANATNLRELLDAYLNMRRR